jgi:hypothetical protein
MATETVSSRIGIDLIPPHGVYVDGKLQEECGSLAAAQRRFADLQRDKRPMPQAPIAAPRYCVMYLKAAREHATPWFYQPEHARRALDIIQRRYGEKNAIIYVD